MFKKFVTGAVVALIITCFSSVAFAGTVVTITRPEGDEVTYNPTYMICGNTDKSGVTVEVQVYDPNKDSYVTLQTNDGDSSWQIGDSGMFMKEVTLPYFDANNVKILSYTSDASQEDKFTITVLRDSIKNKIVNGVVKLKDMISNEIFN